MEGVFTRAALYKKSRRVGFLFPSDFMHLWVKNSVGNFPGGSVCGWDLPSKAGSVDSIPGWEAKIHHMPSCQKITTTKKKQKPEHINSSNTVANSAVKI